MNPEISIVTPAYNPNEFIFETLNSLKNQTFQNFEWIIVDDSSDKKNKGFYKKVKAEASFSVTIITNPSNYRQVKSKNIGLQEAKGKYIKFLDADDLLDRNHLQNQYNLIRNLNQEKCAIFSPTLNFWQSTDNRNEQLNTSYKTVNTNNFEQLKRFLVYPFFHHCGCLFLKQDILEINGFDESLITDEDGDLILRLMLNGLLFIPQDDSVYLYRHHSNKRVSTNDSNDKWEHRYSVCEKIEPQLINNLLGVREQLAQRLDLLAIEAYKQKNPLYKNFLKKAKQVYTNYKYPGNKAQNLMRKYFGFKLMLSIKSILKN